MADNIQVAIRVRQLIQKELAGSLKSHWTVKNNAICCNEADSNGRKPTPYSFDRVFDENTVTNDIFDEVCKPIVDSALAGFNGTIFAYGQSSSGKTFTMSGSRVQPGIITLAVEEIFNHIKSIPDREFLIRVGYLEIYNEKVSDLLSTEDIILKLQGDSDHNIQVVGMTEEIVKDAVDVSAVLTKGNGKRHTAETKQNDRSSRSHCIIRFVIESRLIGHEDDAVMVSNLYFVDLAGSEKAGENTGDRFKEGCSINKSLFVLGMVIRKLSGDSSQQHVSFRDSKLTRILQNALGGNSKTAIICTITPAHIDESDSTLKFASRAKNIKNKPTVNEVMSDAAMLKKYRQKIKLLEEQMKQTVDPTVLMEKAELERQLQMKEAAEQEQKEIIAKLQTMIVISGQPSIEKEKPKGNRRMTWCPGKVKRELESIGKFSPLRKRSRVTPDSTIMTLQEEKDDDSFQLLDSVPVITANSFAVNTSPVNETIQENPAVKELFELQDEYCKLQEEFAQTKAELSHLQEYLRKNDNKVLKKDLQAAHAELEELNEFTQLEREHDREMIKELKDKLSNHADIESSLQWLEDELMKTQQERNSLRQKVESMNMKLSAVEDGSGITEKAKKLSESESLVSTLNSDLDVQKSRYEFHIDQMRRKLEVYTEILEEKGVDPETLKKRLSSEGAQQEETIETERKLVLEQREEFEKELEHQRNHFEAELKEAKEEIKIFQQLLEEKKQSANTNAGSLQQEVEDAERKNLQGQREDFEQELEQQKHQFETELKGAREEIEIYQQLFEEEKKSKTNDGTLQQEMLDTEKKVLQEERDEFEKELQHQKEQYEAELKEARKEIEIYQQVLEEQKEKAKETDGTLQMEVADGERKFVQDQQEKFEQELEQQKQQFETELKDAREEIELYQQLFEEEKKSKTNDGTLQQEMLDTEKKVLQEERDEFEKELQHQKEQYEAELTEARKEVEIYQQVLEEQKEKTKETDGTMQMEVADVEMKIIQVQQEKFEQELQQQKQQFEEELNKAREAIELYQQLLEEQKEHEKGVDGTLQMEVVEAERKLIQEQREEELESQKMKFESELTEAREEIVHYQKLLEEQKAKAGAIIGTQEKVVDTERILLEQREEFEQKLEDQRKKFEAELNDAREEIEITQQLLEEEKTLKSMKEDKVPDNVNEEVVSAEESLANIKEQHGQEIAELKRQLTDLGQANNSLTGDRDDMISRFEYEQSLENLQTAHDKEMSDLNEKLSSIEKSQTSDDLMTAHEKEIDYLKSELNALKAVQVYESAEEVHMELESLEENSEFVDQKEHTHETNSSSENMKTESKKNRRQVTFDIGGEIEIQKEKYEMRIQELVEEKQSYLEMIESLQSLTKEGLNNSVVDDVFENTNAVADVQCEEQNNVGDSKLDTSKEPDVIRVEDEQNIPRESGMFEPMSKDSASSMSIDISIDDDFTVLENDMSVTNRRESFGGESLQAELMKAELACEKGSEELSVEEDMDLKAELLRAEIASLKEKHLDEVETLKTEITSLTQKLEAETNRIKLDDTVLSDVTVSDEVTRMRKDLQEYLGQQEADTSLSGSPMTVSRRQSSIGCDGNQSSINEREMETVTVATEGDMVDSLTETEGGSSQTEACVQTTLIEESKSFLQANYAKTIEETQNEVSSLMYDLKRLSEEIQRLQQDNSRLKRQYMDLNSERETEQQKSTDMEKQMTDIETEKEALAAKVEELEEHIRYGTSLLASKNEAIKLLEESLEEQEALIEAEMAKKTEEIKEYVSELEEKIVNLETDLKMGNERIVELEEANKNEEILKYVSELEEKVILVESDLKVKNEKILQLEEADKTVELQKHVTELQEKIATLEVDVRNGNDKIAELEETESQFSDKVVVLETDVDVYREKEVTLNKMCVDYEEKIVILDGDVNMLKVKNEELEETCADQEKKIEALQMDLEVAQSKDSELTEIQNKYQDKISKLDEELKDVHGQVDQLAKTNAELNKMDTENHEKIGVLHDKMKQSDECACVLRKEKDAAEEQLQSALKELENLNKQDIVYSSTIQELRDQLKQQDENVEALKTKLDDADTEVRGLKDMVTENNFLKERVDTLENDRGLRSELISECETQVSELNTRLEESKKQISELQTETDDLRTKSDLLRSEREKFEAKLNASQEEKRAAEETAETLRAEVESLQEDNFQLEAGLHPKAVRFHSQPENIEWEKNWKEFEKYEKTKRLTLNSKLRTLKYELEHEKKMAKRAKDLALQELYEKEEESDQFKDLKRRLNTAENDARMLEDELEAEQQKARKLQTKLEELESKKVTSQPVLDDKHSCKFKTEYRMLELEMNKVRQELIVKDKQLYDNDEEYKNRVKKMKNEMRRMQSGMDTTFSGPMERKPLFDEKPQRLQQQEQQQQQTPSLRTPKNDSAVTYGSSTKGGVVDHFHMVMMQAEIKTLKQDLSKQKKKFEDQEKENIYLQKKLKQMKEPQRPVDRSTSISDLPLSTIQKTEEGPVEKKRKPSFNIPDLNAPAKDNVMTVDGKDLHEEMNNCKTQ